MEHAAFVSKVKQVFDDLPGQIRIAAGFVLDNPHDVALLSMREQARRAGVPAATMTRFAQALGLSGYDEIRAIHADALRETPEVYGGKAQTLVRRHREVGVAGVAAEMTAALTETMGELSASSRLAAMVAAAKDMVAAQRILCLGQRSSFSVSFHLNYLLSFFDDRSVLLHEGGAGAIGHPALRSAGAKDVLVVACFTPAARQVVKTASFARRRGVKIIAITDSETNPVARLANRTIVVPSRSASFFDSVTPAFATCEVLVALVAGLHKGDVPAAVAKTEAMLWDLGVWWFPDEELPSPEADARPQQRSRAND